MNKIRRKQRIIGLILFLCIPILAAFTSKFIFSKLNQNNSISTIKVENRNTSIKNISSFTIYSIQVGSLNDYEKVKLVEKDLDENQIPNYVVQKDGSYKIYSYTFLDGDKIRTLLDGVKENYNDAFIAKINVPGINFEYTKQYTYMDNVQKDLHDMLANMKSESEFWYGYTMNTTKYESYISIVNERKKIIDSLTKNINNMDKEKTEHFKEKLQALTEKCQKNIQNINSNLGNGNLYSCEKLFLENIFNYYNFVNSLKQN